ncbi:MAG: DUF1801 domain-containing protein [Gammaproteobacteria bacterium]
MAENKTKPTRVSVDGFIAKIKDAERREDCDTLVTMMKKATGEKPVMWGTMIGFGNYHYKYASGHEGDCFMMGFASRKPDLVLSIMNGPERQKELLAKLGKHKLGKCCLYIRRLSDVDTKVVEKLVATCAREMKKSPGGLCS